MIAIALAGIAGAGVFLLTSDRLTSKDRPSRAGLLTALSKLAGGRLQRRFDVSQQTGRRRLNAIYIVAGLIISMNLSAESNSQPADKAVMYEVQAADGMTRVDRKGRFSGAKKVHLYAARNETEPFQIVVSSYGKPLKIVDVSVGKLVGPKQTRITPATLYREHYVPVTKPSPLSQYSPRDYADALIPFRNPVTKKPLAGAVYDAVPFTVAKGENQPVWIDLHVPKTVPAGDYHGQVTVTAEGGLRASLPVTLTVWNFTLPDVPALGSNFGLNGFQVANIYGLDQERDARTVNPLIRSYYDLLFDHLLSPSDLFDTRPNVDPVTGKPDFNAFYPGLGTAAQGLKYYLNRKHASSYSYIFWERSPFSDPLGRDRSRMKNFLTGYVSYLKKHGWSDRAQMPYGFLDEPSSKEAYEKIRNWGRLFNEVEKRAGTPAPLMITEQPEPEDTEWGSLDGYVDIWVPEFNAVWLDEYHNSGAIKKQLAAGNRVWSYAALAYVPSEWSRSHPFSSKLKDSHPPKWLTDYAPINFRIPGWLNALSGITGLLYWDTIWWADGVDVWKDAGTYRHEDKNNPDSWGLILNGEGFLIYPGFRNQIGFDGPVPSIRLKWFRESVEDYAYIQLLRDAGEWGFAKKQINRFARGVGDWKDDTHALYEARRAMGERLSALHGKQ